MRAVVVWDLPTRIFHWALVVAVVVSVLTGEEEGALFVVHTISGYLILLLLLFRLMWGVVGSPHSRFSDFIYSAPTVRGYARQLLRLKPPNYVGHNPLGGWMVVLLLSVLLATVVTGLFSGGDHGASGLFLPLIAAPGGEGLGGEGLGEIHEVLGNVVIALAIVHVLGVFVDWLLNGENLVRPMITGVKKLDETQAASERPLVKPWRAVIVAAVVALAGVYLILKTDFAALKAGQTEQGYRHGGERDESKPATVVSSWPIEHGAGHMSSRLRR